MLPQEQGASPEYINKRERNESEESSEKVKPVFF